MEMIQVLQATLQLHLRLEDTVELVDKMVEREIIVVQPVVQVVEVLVLVVELQVQLTKDLLVLPQEEEEEELVQLVLEPNGGNGLSVEITGSAATYAGGGGAGGQ